MEVSLTTFVDFVAKSGSPKITCVRTAKADYGQPYEPSHDYWLPLRTAIVSMHVNGHNLQTLQQCVAAAHTKKAKNYAECAKGYRKWMRGQQLGSATAGKTVVWSHAGLDVRVNPELQMMLGGRRHVIKLYFKSDAITAQRVSTANALLHATWGHRGAVGILDVRRARLYPFSPVQGLAALLAGEAATFAQIWAQV